MERERRRDIATKVVTAVMIVAGFVLGVVGTVYGVIAWY